MGINPSNSKPRYSANGFVKRLDPTAYVRPSTPRARVKALFAPFIRISRFRLFVPNWLMGIGIKRLSGGIHSFGACLNSHYPYSKRY